MTSPEGDSRTPPALPGFTWARTSKSGYVVASAAPIRPDGTFEVGPVRDQADLTYRNLEASLREVGCQMSRVLHVTVFLTDLEDGPASKQAWDAHFDPPYPNRATVGVRELGVPGMRIEIVAHAFA